MKKFLAAFTALLSFPFLLTAQTCQLTESPTVRGLKLGQSYEEMATRIRSRRPSIIEKIQGVRVVWITNPDFPPNEFEGVDHAWLTYIEGSLAEVDIHYTDDVKWRDSEEFAHAIGKAFNLPKEAWTGVPSIQMRMECKGFSVRVTAPRTFTLSRAGLEEELKIRKRAAEQRKREEFKP